MVFYSIYTIFAVEYLPIFIMETTKKNRTREEVRAAFREYQTDKKLRMEENQRELKEIHQMRMSGMTMEEIFA